jgi:hypothetical protein
MLCTSKTHNGQRKAIGVPPVILTTQHRPQVVSWRRSTYNGSVMSYDGHACKVWYQALTEMAEKELIICPRGNVFPPGKRATRGMLGKPLLARHYIPRSLLAWISLKHGAANARLLTTFASGHAPPATRTTIRATHKPALRCSVKILARINP